MDSRHHHHSSVSRNTSAGPIRQPTSSSSIKRQYSGASADGKRHEKKTSLGRRDSQNEVKDGELRIKTQFPKDHRDDTIDDLKGELDKLRRHCICVICQDLLFEPYLFQCGHVYCYTCIVSWIKQAKSRKKRFCPQCRVVIKETPAPAYIIRDMIEVFVQRAEVMSPTGSGSELRTAQKEMAVAIKKDTQGPGLFKGLFQNQLRDGILDPEDGVLRCPDCNWEVHGGRCENPDCGIRVGAMAYLDDLDSEIGEGGGLDEPDRWPESALDSELTAEEADDFDDDDEDLWEDEVGFQENGFGNNGFPHRVDLTEDDDEDEEGPVTNRSRRAVAHLDDESEESDSDDTEGSLADFVDHDTPEQRRIRNSRGMAARAGVPWALPDSSPAPEPVQPPRRANARPIVVDDDDDDDDPSSMSEASSRPGFRSARNHVDHLTLSSDYDEDESLLETDYETFANQTASENEDDGVFGSRHRAARRRTFLGMSATGSVFSVPEEEESESDSEDTDGDMRMNDARMSRNRSTSANSRNLVRRPGGGTSRAQPIELDSASESEVGLSSHRRPRRPPTQTTSRTNYFSAHQRNTGRNRGAEERASRPLSALIDPDIQDFFRSHSQRLADQQFNALGGRTSVSPARSLTPVQRDITGERRRGSFSRESTPMNPVNDHTPSPFSPLQSPDLRASHQTPITINSNSSQVPSVPSSPSSYHSASSQRLQSMSPRIGSSAGSGNQNFNFSGVFMANPVQRTASPGMRGLRGRTSNNRLRSSNSRTGLRSNSTVQSPIQGFSSFGGGTSIAGIQGRVPQQQPTTGGAGALGAGRGRAPITLEDIRARGIASRQQSQQGTAGGQQLGRRNSRREMSGPTGDNGVAIGGPGRRLAAQIGGGQPGSGGAMLVFGSED